VLETNTRQHDSNGAGSRTGEALTCGGRLELAEGCREVGGEGAVDVRLESGQVNLHNLRPRVTSVQRVTTCAARDECAARDDVCSGAGLLRRGQQPGRICSPRLR
jgi:hypothetical protein